MPPTGDTPHETPQKHNSPANYSDGGSYRRGGIAVSDGRPSGELEGSTLGSGSRDGDRRTPAQRRNQSSGGFLLDSLPRSKSLRIPTHHARSSESPTEKRSIPEPDIVVAKKRSRFPWSRHKNSPSEPTTAAAASSAPAPNEQASTSSNHDRQSRTSSQTGSGPNDNAEQAAPGLDRDSIQIVNLALNLNESRRRNTSGLPLASGGRKPLSIAQPAPGPIDHHMPLPGVHGSQRNSSHHDYKQSSTNDLSPKPGQSPVISLLPANVRSGNDHRAYEFSESTLARAERARRHFELFDQYLRLLPSLPPLRTPPSAKEIDSPYSMAAIASANRDYNPLQMIRNRRVRYREKCPIDAAAEGWHNVEKVHDWVSAIENKYSHKTLDSTQSVKLPSFQQSQRTASHCQDEDWDVTTSPPASLRRVSRTNSIKVPRLRMDWRVTPEELLADAAWAEDIENKTKIVDKDGNRLYPDLTELEVVDPGAEKQRLSVETGHAQEEGQSSRHTSWSSSRPAQSHEFKSVRRGRNRSRLHSHSHGARSKSGSISPKHSRWDKVRLRSGSASSDSSPDRDKSSERKHRIWDHTRKSTELTTERDQRNSSGSRVSRGKSPAAALHLEKSKSNLPDPLSINTKSSRPHRKASFSSAGSIDDRINPRMSMEGMDSTAPNSPANDSYFPSIAVNLSPPSSRSPSPAKRGLRHKIVARRERSKSKNGDRELREHEDESLDVISESHHALTPPSEYAEHAASSSKLEPSPLPDVVSSSYFDEHGMTDGQRADSFPRGRKGQQLPESKLRGIFKGPGRIAELVGNEVSKVGDLVFKKDQGVDSRKSSSASTIASDSSDSEDDGKKTDKRYGPKGLLRRLPNLGDEPSRLVRRDSDRGTPNRSFIGSLPSFTSPLRQDERNESTDTTDYGTSPRERTSAFRKQDDQDTPPRPGLTRSRTLDFSPTLGSNRSRVKRHGIRDQSVPFSLTRPPVTGLAQARASPGPANGGRPALSSATRAWSISDRSLHTLNDSGVPGKTEVERTRALLLSSGIKAREITRRAHSVREPPPHWLQNAFGPNASVPRVVRIGEFDLAAQNLLRRFENTQYSFQQSMHHFTTSTSVPLRSQLKELETLVNQSLTPRVRATADDAEDMCVQLNTTSTLAVKSLSDALDRGLRKRRRRFRWLRRTGFVVLEWTLVGVLWWVWLIVMAFKLLRGVFRGAISSARWILWL